MSVPALLATKAQAAESMACSEKTIARMIDRGELRAVYLGRAVRVPVDELKRWIAVHQHGQEGTA